MPAKIGELLVKEGIITQKQLEEALKCQVIFGGRLGTNLIEMGWIEEQKLVEYLSRQLSVPFATPDELMSVPPEVIKLISREMAEEYKMIPLKLEKKRLTVAIWDPSDLSAIDAVSFITGYIIKPLVCSELRLLTALEMYYGIKREVRYIQMKGGTGSRTRETPDVKPGPSSESGNEADSPFSHILDELPPPSPKSADAEQSWAESLEFAPQVQKSPAAQSQTPAAPAAALPVEEPDIVELLDSHQEPQPAPAPQAAPRPAAPPPPQKTAAPPAEPAPAVAEEFTLDQLLACLAEARDRDSVADALAAFLGRNYQSVALFMIKGRIAAGWKGMSGNKAIPGFETFQIPLDEPSLLKVVTDTRNFYLGPLLDTPGNAKIIEALGAGEPDNALLIPLMMMERVVTVLYLAGDKALLGKDLFALQKLAGKVSLAFEILILKNKILLA